ncbi:MAG: hypothetical protein ABGY42_02315 [bacterium]
MIKRILKWLAIGLGLVAGTVFVLDTFGGRFLDGPLGPIPGGRMVGAVDPTTNPDWSGTEDVIEIEIRPDQPWSLSVWRAVVDGDLYIPSGNGAERRWTPIAVADRRVRIRTQGRIYEGCLERIEDSETRLPVLQTLVANYDLDATGGDDGSVWLFRVTERARCE